MTETDDLIARLNAACVDWPAKIPWPHRLLHEAADRLAELQNAEAEQRTERLRKALERLEHEVMHGSHRKARDLVRARTASDKQEGGDATYLKRLPAPE